MALEEDTRRDVSDSPKEAGGDSGVAGIARDSQLKSDSQKDYELEHEKKRRAGATDSTKDLPRLDLLLDMVRHSGAVILNALTGLGKERSIKTHRELAVSPADMAVDGGISAHPSGDTPDMELPEEIHEFLQLVKGYVPEDGKVAEGVVSGFDEGGAGEHLLEDVSTLTGVETSLREHPELIGTVEELTKSLDLVM